MSLGITDNAAQLVALIASPLLLLLLAYLSSRVLGRFSHSLRSKKPELEREEERLQLLLLSGLLDSDQHSERRRRH